MTECNLFQLFTILISIKLTYSAYCTYCLEDDPTCENFGYKTIDTTRGENRIVTLNVDGDGIFRKKNLSDCLPKMYKIVKLKSLCCFWSKETGCTIIAPKRNLAKKVIKKCDQCVALSGCKRNKQLPTSNRSAKLCLNKLLIGLAITIIIIINKV